MKSLIKGFARRTLYRDGTTRTIRRGPLRGLRYRVGPITGLSPLYSGSERALQKCIARNLEVGSTVIDLGANWGTHTLLCARLVGDAGQVVACEPSPKVFCELQWTVRTNELSNVRLMPLAIGDRDAKATFALGESAYTGHLEDLSEVPEPTHCTVQVSTLDSLVERLELRSVDLVKIDVEGAESRVLSGAGECIARFRPRFIIELHTPEQDIRVAQILRDSDYRLLRLSGDPIKHPDRGWPDLDGVWGHILALPTEQT